MRFCVCVLGLYAGASMMPFMVRGEEIVKESLAPYDAQAGLLEKNISYPGGIGTIKTWQETLAQAYFFNPALKIAQSRLREVQEGRKQAWGEWVPQIQGNLSQTGQETYRGTHTFQRTKQGGIQASQSVFSSFGSVQRLKSTNRRIQAALMNLVAEENKTLIEALNAFLQVYTVQKNLEFYKLDEARSQAVYKQTKARFEVGEVTLTDVMAQEAKLAGSTARRVQGEGGLATARAKFQAIVGKEVGENLVWPEDLPLLIPQKLEEAIQLALKENPSVLSAFREEEAARYGVNSEMADQLGPKVDVTAAWQRTVEARKLRITDISAGRRGVERDLTARVNVTVPIATGIGQSKVRVTEQRLTQARYTRQQTQFSVRQALVEAWAEYAMAKQQVVQFHVEVKANTQAFEGAREEYTLGSKNVIDLGIIQDRLVESQVNLVNGQQKLLLAQARILGLLGRFLTENLQLDVRRYNPEAYNPWFLVGYDQEPAKETEIGGSK